jgi:HrpA-like RNA helicase
LRLRAQVACQSARLISNRPIAKDLCFFQKSYDALTEVSMLKTAWVSKTSSAQRKGRAGRVRPGVVYRLYSSIRHENFFQFQTPGTGFTNISTIFLSFF